MSLLLVCNKITRSLYVRGAFETLNLSFVSHEDTEMSVDSYRYSYSNG